MATVYWRPEVNALTQPESFRIQYVPRGTVGYTDLAQQIASANPHYNAELVRTICILLMKQIQHNLINGNQVTLEDAFTFRLSFTGRLTSPDEQLSEKNEFVQVKVFPSLPFVKQVRHAVRLERVRGTKKVPLVLDTKDMLLKLPNVLNSGSALQLLGNHLQFDPKRHGAECVIEGTRSGKAVQTQLLSIKNSSILLLPNIPPQEETWNNEYRLSVSTYYGEHGKLRTSTYSQMLRSPLRITLPIVGAGQGILTGNAAMPYVRLTGGTVNAAEMLRIQVSNHSSSGTLLIIKLFDMQEGGRMGIAVRIPGNGSYTLPGFADSAVLSLEINVEYFDALVSLVRKNYSGQLLEVLDLRIG